MTYTREDVEKYDPDFVDDLIDGHKCEVMVAEWLKNLGYEVRTPKFDIRPSIKDNPKYSDKGDIYAYHPERWGGEERVVEVKHYPQSLFCYNDKYQDIIVCTRGSFDKAINTLRQPYGYIMLNKNCTSYYALPVYAFGECYPKKIHPETRGYKAKEVYMIDRKKLCSRPFSQTEVPTGAAGTPFDPFALEAISERLRGFYEKRYYSINGKPPTREVSGASTA